LQSPQTKTKFQTAIAVNTIWNMSTQPLPGNYSTIPIPQMSHMPYFQQQTHFPISSMYGGYMGQPVPGAIPGVNPMHSMYGMPVTMNMPMTNTMPYPPSMIPFGYPMGAYYGHMPGNILGSAGTTVLSVSPCQNPGFGKMGFNPQSQNMALNVKRNVMTENQLTTLRPQNMTTHSTVIDPQGGAKIKTNTNENPLLPPLHTHHDNAYIQSTTVLKQTRNTPMVPQSLQPQDHSLPQDIRKALDGEDGDKGAYESDALDCRHPKQRAVDGSIHSQGQDGYKSYKHCLNCLVCNGPEPECNPNKCSHKAEILSTASCVKQTPGDSDTHDETDYLLQDCQMTCSASVSAQYPVDEGVQQVDEGVQQIDNVDKQTYSDGDGYDESSQMEMDDGQPERGKVLMSGAALDAGRLTSNDATIFRDHQASCDITQEVYHLACSNVSPEMEQHVRALQMESIQHLWEEAPFLQNLKYEVLVSHQLGNTANPTRQANCNNCSQELHGSERDQDSTESAVEAQQKIGNNQRAKTSYQSKSQSNGIISMDPRNTNWSAPFLDYDKAVVIKLRHLCVN
jgi:hypothetical protein